MSLRDTMMDWMERGTTPAPKPLCSKRLVIKNLHQIMELLEGDSPLIAGERIKFLIRDIQSGKLDGGNL